MKILAVEFSSERRSVAVVSAGSVRGRTEDTGGRTARAFGLIERALAEADMVREEIECIAVGLGPGSYAGIRSSISLAQGWQLGRGIRLLGLSTVECMAAQAQAAGISGHVNVLIDAQRNEFYFASYDISTDGVSTKESLRLLSLEEVQNRCVTGETLIWPDLKDRFQNGQVLLPDAVTLGLLAESRTEFVSGDKLEPIYLRETSFIKAPPARVIPSVQSS